MPRSMTAYGRAARAVPAGPDAPGPDGDAATPAAEPGEPAGPIELAWELRSVNHRFLELSVHLPEPLRGLEGAVRERLRARVRRGKLDATLRSGGAGAARVLDASALDALVADLARVRERVPDARAPDALELLRHPGVLVRPEKLAARDDDGPEPLDGAVPDAALEALDAALDDFLAARTREGEALADAIRARGEAVRGIVAGVRARRPEALAAARARLVARLEALADASLESGAGGAAPDPGRLEQELALLAARSDVDEELDRLDHHVDELGAVLTRDPSESVGRRLDFLVQELHREANTLSSKAADITTTNAALELKVLVEQMREQVQNLD